MSAYQPPIRDMHFAMTELADFEAVAKLPGFEDAADVLEPILEEAGNFASEVLDPLNADRRPDPLQMDRRQRQNAARLQRGLPQVRRGRLDRAADAGRIRRPRAPAVALHSHPGDVERREHGLRALPAAEPRRHRSAAALRHRRAKAALRSQADLRRVDRDDGSHGAAGRFGPRSRFHPRRPRRRSLPHLRQQDSSSRTASTTTRKTSSTWCWPARRRRRKASRASRCSSFPSSSPRPTVRRASATT